jgi:hypothetical protein
MTFKNEQFERGVQQSLHSLEELKKALDLDKSAESLSNLEKIASSFDISGIADGIDEIANRFTLLGNIGQEAFRRISSFALDEVHKVTSALTSMPQAGMDKYEQKNKTVQMIQSALPDKPLEEIEAVLEKLNKYTDLTSYDYSSMANNMGKFISAGVDMEVAEKVMEGIANEAASAGGEIWQANIAMNNFSQALAAGSVKLMDWRSIQNQNLDTKEFKEQIIETAYELGTLQKVQDKVGMTTKGNIVDFQSFADTLSEGWFNTDVLIRVFEKYANRKEGVGKKGFEAAKIAITLSQALDAVKDAISTGWMTSFGYLFGNLEEAGDLFTRISDALIEFTDQISGARNALLEGWHTGGEDGISGYQKVIEGLSNTWATMMGIVDSVKEAFTNVFGVLDSSGLIDASKAFADFTANMREFFGVTTETKTSVEYVEEVWDGVEQWTRPLQKGVNKSKQEVINLQQQLIKLTDGSEELKKHGVDGIFGPETEKAIKNFQKKVGIAQTGIYDQQTRDALAKTLYPNGKIRKVAQENEETTTRLGKGAQKLKGIFEGVASVGKAGLGVIQLGLKLFGQVYKIILPVGKGILELASGLGRLISLVVDFVTKTSAGEKVLSAFNAVLSPIATAFKKIGGFLVFVGNGISDIVIAVRKGIGSFEELGEKLKLNPKVNANGIILYNVLTKLLEVGKKVAPVFKSLWDILTGMFNAVKGWLSDKISTALSALGTFFTGLLETISQGDYLEKILTGIGTALQVILGIVSGVGYGIYSLAKALVEGGVALFNFVKNSEFVQNALSAIAKWTKPIRDFFGSVWDSLTSISDKFSTFKSFKDVWEAFISSLKNNPVGKKFASAFETFGQKVQKVRNRISTFINSIKTAFRMLNIFKDPVKALEVLNLNPDRNRGAIKFLDIIVKIGNAFQRVKDIATDAIKKIVPGVKNFGVAIANAVKNFFGGDGKTPGEKIGNTFDSVKSKLKTAFENFGKWVENLVKNSPFLSKLVGFGKMIGDAVNRFFSMDTSQIEGIPGKIMARLKAFDPVIQWIKDKFSAIKEFLMDPDKLLSHVVGALKGIGEFVIGIFKNFNISTIWNAATTALGTYIMLTFANSLKNFSESVGVLTGAIDEDEKEGIGDKLRSIAITIAIVTAALAALAFIPAKEAIIGVGIMAVALGVVSAALFAMNKWAPKTGEIGEGVLNLSKSIIAIVLAIGLAAAVIATAGDLTKPLLLVGGIIVALGLAAFAMSKFGKKYTGATTGTAKTILAICAGVYIVVKAVGKMAKLIKDNETKAGRLDSALGYVTGILILLGLAAIGMAKVAGKIEGEGPKGIATTILAICTGLSSVVSAVGQMAGVMKQYPNEFGGAYAMIEGLLITIGAIAVLLAKFSGDLDWKVSLASTAPIVAMGFFLDKAVSVMTEGIQKISGVDPKVIEQFLIGVAEAVAAMVGTVAIFSQIGIQGLLEAAAGIVVLMGAIGLGVDLMATFAADAVEKLAAAMWIVGSNYGGFSDLVANVNTAKIEEVMGTLTNTILPAIARMVQYSGTIQTGKETAMDIKRIGTRLGLFRDAISDITVNTGEAIKKLPEDIKATVDGINSIEGVDAAKDVLYSLGGALKTYYGDLAYAMEGESPTDSSGNFDIEKANQAFNDLAELTLTDETIAKLQRFSDNGDQNLNTVAGGIGNLGTALKQYGEDISTIDPDKVDKANEIIDKVKDLDSHLNPVADTNFDVLKGKRQNISDFGDDIAELGTALESYSDSVSKLNPAKIVMANIVMDAVSRLANKLPTTGGLWQMLTGEQSLGTFAANMNNLGDGLAQYANKVSEAKYDNVEASVTVVQGLAQAQSILQRYNGLKSLVEGTAGLDNLGENLVGLGKSLVSFATDAEGIKNLKDADFKQLEKAMGPITGLARAQSILQREGGLKAGVEGEASLANLGTGLENFGQSLKTFSGSVQDFDFDDTKFTSAMDLLQKIVSLQEIVQNGDPEYDFANAGRNVSTLFASIATTIRDDTQISEAVTGAIESIQMIIKTNALDKAYTWGSDLVINFHNGMQQYAHLIEEAANSIATIIWSYLHFTKPEVGPMKDADTWGGDMDSTIADGIANNQDIIEQAVNGVASAVSDKFGETGGNAVRNFWDTFTNSESESAAGKARDGIIGAIQGLFSDSGLDQPTITPVLDLSNVEDGLDGLDGMLNGQSVAASANLAKNVSSGNGVTIIQGGSTEDHTQEIITSIKELGDRIVTLENQMASHMSNLKVVMNTNALVGQIAPAMDRALGVSANRG